MTREDRERSVLKGLLLWVGLLVLVGLVMAYHGWGWRGVFVGLAGIGGFVLAWFVITATAVLIYSYIEGEE